MSTKRTRRASGGQRTTFEIEGRAGLLIVTANSQDHAERQAFALGRDIRHRAVRNQVEILPAVNGGTNGGLFILGDEAHRMTYAASVGDPLCEQRLPKFMAWYKARQMESHAVEDSWVPDDKKALLV